MKITFISCFDNYDIRIKPAIDFFEEKGIECHYITSDFNHRSKSKKEVRPHKNTTLINVPGYVSNLSIKRIISHIIFSFKVYKFIKKENPEVIYTIIPPNFLVYLFKNIYKKGNTKVIYDVYDMWPETFPINKKNKLIQFIFSRWEKLRSKNIKYSNLIITECALFKDKINRQNPDSLSEVLYLCGDDYDENQDKRIDFSKNPESNSDEITLSYIGSINNIFDIELTMQIIKKVNELKKVKLLIIGDGEKRHEFLNRLDDSGIDYEFYGIVYDENKKQEILQKSMFGLNIMKDSVFVGLTMKSIEYFKNGIPIINNINHDTEKLINNYKAGININNEKDLINEIIMCSNNIYNLKKNVQILYKDKFSRQSYNNKMEKIWIEYLK